MDKCPSCDTSKKKYQSEVYGEWTSDLRKSHPCPRCLKRPSWFGKVCGECQADLELWCPCNVDPPYGCDARGSLSGYIVSETCNRCGLRIKELWECDDDDEFDRLLDKYEVGDF